MADTPSGVAPARGLDSRSQLAPGTASLGILGGR
jgi:hypothetical protein